MRRLAANRRGNDIGQLKAQVSDLQGCVLIESHRMAQLEAKVRRGVETQKTLEQSAVTSEVLVDSLKQLAHTVDEQLKDTRRAIDAYVDIQARSFRVIDELTEKCVKLAKKMDGCFGLQQQQAELNETILEVIGLESDLARLNGVVSYGKETSNDVDVDLLEETMVASVGSCGIEEEGEGTCVVCGIEEQARLHPSSGSENAIIAKALQDNENKGTRDDNLQGHSLGCSVVSISVRPSSSSSCDPNAHQLSSPRSVSIFNSSLETIFRQSNSIRSGGNMQKFQDSCSMVQKSFLAEAWLQYRQEPNGMLTWLDSYMEKALDKADVMVNWCEVNDIMELLMSSEQKDDDSDVSDVSAESDEIESE